MNLHRAATENQKLELKGQVLGFSVALMNALDLTFGGKAGILENWLNAMEASGSDRSSEDPRRPSSLSPGAKAFFMGLPRTKRE